MVARAICLRLLTHCDRRAASRAACTAGSKSAIKTAMIAMTTRSSISVKPLVPGDVSLMMGLARVMKRRADEGVRRGEFKDNTSRRWRQSQGSPKHGNTFDNL